MTLKNSGDCCAWLTLLNDEWANRGKFFATRRFCRCVTRYTCSWLKSCLCGCDEARGRYNVIKNLRRSRQQLRQNGTHRVACVWSRLLHVVSERGTLAIGNNTSCRSTHEDKTKKRKHSCRALFVKERIRQNCFYKMFGEAPEKGPTSRTLKNRPKPRSLTTASYYLGVFSQPGKKTGPNITTHKDQIPSMSHCGATDRQGLQRPDAWVAKISNKRRARVLPTTTTRQSGAVRSTAVEAKTKLIGPVANRNVG